MHCNLFWLYFCQINQGGLVTILAKFLSCYIMLSVEKSPKDAKYQRGAFQRGLSYIAGGGGLLSASPSENHRHPETSKNGITYVRTGKRLQKTAPDTLRIPALGATAAPTRRSEPAAARPTANIFLRRREQGGGQSTQRGPETQHHVKIQQSLPSIFQKKYQGQMGKSAISFVFLLGRSHHKSEGIGRPCGGVSTLSSHDKGKNDIFQPLADRQI